jgi:serine/threonine protein phosphatase 1
MKTFNSKPRENFIPDGRSVIGNVCNNSKGRDFIIGDLHASIYHLEKLLKHVDFNPSFDRCFSVGDLIDRGPNSYECLDLLNEDFFFSVLGNHESNLLFMLRIFEDDNLDEDFDDEVVEFLQKIGRDWILKNKRLSTDKIKNSTMQKLKTIPLVMNINDSGGLYHVVHAELIGLEDGCETITTTESLTGSVLPGNDMAYITGFRAHGTWMDRALYGRSIANAAKYGRVFINPSEYFTSRLNTVYCGHTVTDSFNFKLLNHVFLDTGSGKNRKNNAHGLTIFSPKENTGFIHVDGKIKKW